MERLQYSESEYLARIDARQHGNRVKRVKRTELAKRALEATCKAQECRLQARAHFHSARLLLLDRRINKEGFRPYTDTLHIDMSRPKPIGVITDIQCGTCGKAIGKHPLFGTTCDCVHYFSTPLKLHPAQKALRKVREIAKQERFMLSHGPAFVQGVLYACNHFEEALNKPQP